MTQPINFNPSRARSLNRIFNPVLKDADEQPQWGGSRLVQAVVSVDDIFAARMKITLTYGLGNNVPNAGAVYLTDIVPMNKRRTYYGMHMGINGGVYTMKYLYIVDSNDPNLARQQIKPDAPNSTDLYLFPNDPPLELEPGWGIGFFCDTWTSIGQSYLISMYKEYDA